MEFKLICIESAEGQPAVTSSVHVLCPNNEAIDAAKQTICSFMDGKKIFKGIIPETLLSLQPVFASKYALRNADRIIVFQKKDSDWEYEVHYVFDTICDEPIDFGTLRDQNLTASLAAMSICSKEIIDPGSMRPLLPSEISSFFEPKLEV